MELGSRYQLIDLFCGCGGLSLGFSLTNRFNITLGCDIKPEAIETFQKNHENRGTSPICIGEDIRKISAAKIEKLVRTALPSAERQLTCLVGGPPCEGFSQNRSLGSGGKSLQGKAVRIGKFIEDERNYLFRSFVEIAAALRPAAILIENVPDLIRHQGGKTREEILGVLSDAGYRATVRVLNAANYGVPQMRRRAFFLAQRKEDYDRTGISLELPSPTHRPFPLSHSTFNDREDWLPGDAGYWTTVREAIGDLPSPFDSDDFDHDHFKYPNAARSTLRGFLRDPTGAVPFNHIRRSLGKNGLLRARALRSGARADSLPDELRPRTHYHYSYARLNWGEPARTITKFVYHVGSGMFTHPDEDRAITMREAARLQTFPDSFRFHASGIRELSALVGSAVPPLLAQRIAQEVVFYLDRLTYRYLTPAARAEVRTQATDAVLRRMETDAWSSEEPVVSQLDLDLAGEEDTPS